MHDSTTPNINPDTGRAYLICSFCGKTEKQAARLIAGRGVYICDECVALCVEILAEEDRAEPAREASPMHPEQAADFVREILVRNNLEFATRDDGLGHRIRAGVTAVDVTFPPWGEDDSIVIVSAVLLEDLEEDVAAKALESINRLNCDRYFGKFCLRENVISIEHVMLASQMQADELMSALSVIANTANQSVEELQRELGGKTWGQVQEAKQDGDGLEPRISG